MPGTERQHPSHRITTPQGRVAEYLALEVLRSRGYTVIRSASQESLIHLVAWRGRDRPVFVRIRRSRRPARLAADVVSRWPEDIRELRMLLRRLDGSIQLWIYSTQGWQIYEILPGGIAEVEA